MVTILRLGRGSDLLIDEKVGRLEKFVIASQWGKKRPMLDSQKYQGERTHNDVRSTNSPSTTGLQWHAVYSPGLGFGIRYLEDLLTSGSPNAVTSYGSSMVLLQTNRELPKLIRFTPFCTISCRATTCLAMRQYHDCTTHNLLLTAVTCHLSRRRISQATQLHCGKIVEHSRRLSRGRS